MELESVTGGSPAEIPTTNLASETKLPVDLSIPTANLTYSGNEDTSIPLRRDQKNRARVQFLALCWTLFLIGWNDGTTGPLLPRIQLAYDVRSCLS
jgi:hypothetical protein